MPLPAGAAGSEALLPVRTAGVHSRGPGPLRLGASPPIPVSGATGRLPHPSAATGPAGEQVMIWGKACWSQRCSGLKESSTRASLVAQTVKNLPAVQETRVQSLGWEDPLKEGMVTHSSILAWRIRGQTWWATVHGVAMNWTRLSD